MDFFYASNAVVGNAILYLSFITVFVYFRVGSSRNNPEFIARTTTGGFVFKMLMGSIICLFITVNTSFLGEKTFCFNIHISQVASTFAIVHWVILLACISMKLSLTYRDAYPEEAAALGTSFDDPLGYPPGALPNDNGAGSVEMKEIAQPPPPSSTAASPKEDGGDDTT